MRVLPLFGLAACALAPDAPVSFDEAEPLEALGWTYPGEPGPKPPPVAGIGQAHAAMVGAAVEIRVSGIPAGTDVQLVASLRGPGVGPCHPTLGVCVDLLAPRRLGRATADPTGQASFSVDPPSAGWFAFQAVVLTPGAAGTSPVLETQVADVDVVWTFDQLEVTVDEGESAYVFGMAETFAGPLGWYGEDCEALSICHPMGASLVLDSEHPAIGGIGIPGVAAGLTTLFYDIHGPYVTYYLEGLDSGDCFAWGDDPSYYPDCTPL